MDSGHGAAASMAASIGRRGLHREPTIAAATAPTPHATLTMPNTATSPYTVLATEAPRTKKGARASRIETEKVAIVTQTQARARTAAQPSLSSTRIDPD